MNSYLVSKQIVVKKIYITHYLLVVLLLKHLNGHHHTRLTRVHAK